MSARLILKYGDVTTDMRTDDTLTVDGLETFVRVAYQQHTEAILFATAVEAKAART